MKVSFFGQLDLERKVFLRQLIRKVLVGEKKGFFQLSLIFVNAGQMQELNFRYLKVKRPTDVLAFAQNEGRYLGEVVVCLAEVEKNARKFQEPLARELARVVIHGLLHLLGYEHERSGGGREKMMRKEEGYLRSLNQISKIKKQNYRSK